MYAYPVNTFKFNTKPWLAYIKKKKNGGPTNWFFVDNCGQLLARLFFNLKNISKIGSHLVYPILR